MKASLCLGADADRELLERLERVGIDTMESILCRNVYEIVQKADIPLQQAQHIVSLAMSAMAPSPRKLSDLPEVDSISFSSFGNPQLDKALPGGIGASRVVELVGAPETLLDIMRVILGIIKQVLLHPSTFVVYIDTDGVYYRDLLQHPLLRPFTDRIVLYRTNTVRELIAVIKKLDSVISRLEEMEHNAANPSVLLVIDTVAGPFRRDYDGTMMFERQKSLNGMCAMMKKLMLDHSLSVVAVNQLIGVNAGVRVNSSRFWRQANQDVAPVDNDSDELKAEEEMVAALGFTWGHMIDTRIRFQNGGSVEVFKGGVRERYLLYL